MESAHWLINSRWIFQLGEEWHHHECWCWNIWLLQAWCTHDVYLLSGRFWRIVVQDDWRGLSLRRWAWNWIWALFDYTSDPRGLVGDGKQFGVNPKSSWEVWVSTGVWVLWYMPGKFLKNLIFHLLYLFFNNKKPPKRFRVFRSDQSKHLVVLTSWKTGSGERVALTFWGSLSSNKLKEIARCPRRLMWCDPEEKETSRAVVEGCFLVFSCNRKTQMFRRRTKSWASTTYISIPLGCARWKEFQPLCEPSIRLPSEARCWARHPFLTWPNWSACTWHKFMIAI